MRTEQTSHGRIVRIMYGEFRERVTEGTPNSKPRENKNGDIVHELSYGKISGKISWVEIKESDYGDELCITLVTPDGEGQLRINYDSRQSCTFLERMENIDYRKEVTFELWQYEHPFLAVLQDGNLIKKKYEKGDTPEWEEKTINKKKVLDKTNYLTYFQDVILQVQTDLGMNGNTPKSADVKNDPVPVDLEDKMPWE